MQWLNKIIDEIVAKQPGGEIIVSSGVSPSGKYHLGTLREVLTAEVIMRELKRRGRTARHIHFVDDLDALRKIPVGINTEFEKYLGQPLYKVPAPAGSPGSYADYFLNDLLNAASLLKLEMEVVRSHQKYQAGFFTPAIETALEHIDEVRRILETISGHKLGEEWSPIQINEEGYLKKRRFVGIDKSKRTVTYEDKDGKRQSVNYAKGDVKLDWRIDWPARWWLLKVDAEPFGRDHATKGGSYDTGAALMESVFRAPAPLSIPYAFINRIGETKKMSKSAGDTVNLEQLLQILEPELVWYFIIRYAPQKQLFFDESLGLIRLSDEFSELLAKKNKTPEQQQLIELCTYNLQRQVSRVPFSHLAFSYQAALRNGSKTMDIIRRTERIKAGSLEENIIKAQLVYIDYWLGTKAPEDMKFELTKEVRAEDFSEAERAFFAKLADKIAAAPAEADGDWFHKAIYNLKDEVGMEPKAMFETLYKALIGKNSGPRAGWFLSILPRDWLIKRLNLEA